MKALTSTSLREQASQVIRASVLSGELKPGEIYSAIALAERLRVSPTPVREAMLDLAAAGLVEPVRNRGFRVLTADETDMEEIIELRLLLEVAPTRKVVAKATDEELDELEEAVVAAEVAAKAGNAAELLLADRRFHIGLLELAGNRRLVRLVAQLRDQTRLMGLKPLAEAGNLDAAAHEHRVLLEALRARDADRAEALMRAHLEHARGVWAGRDEAAAEPAVSAGH
jgi:DNA-binding GntR family transcriptional regulator